jgi:hypothetical protein
MEVELLQPRRHMKTKYAPLLVAGLFITSTTTSPAQNLATNLAANNAANSAANTATSLATNVAPSAPTNAAAPAEIPEFGQPLLPPELKERLKLSDTQQAELKTIEDDFARTLQEYEAANKARIDAAYEADRQARLAKDERLIKAAAEQFTLVWAGVRPERKAAMARVKEVLTPEQLKFVQEQTSLLKN